MSPERKSIYKTRERSGREGRRSLCPVFGQMERTQHVKDCIHLRYIEGWVIGGGGGGKFRGHRGP